MESFKELSPEIVEDLKSQGYKAGRLLLRPESGRSRAIVELLPCKDKPYDSISFSKEEITEYTVADPALPKYIINEQYLSDKGSL